MENEFLIKKIVRSYQSTSNLPYEDLYQEAVLAYFEALQSHDPGKGAITTFVWHCISNRLRNYLDKENKHIDAVEPLNRVRKTVSHSPVFEFLTSGGEEIFNILKEDPSLVRRGKTQARKEIAKILKEKDWDSGRIRKEFAFLRMCFS